MAEYIEREAVLEFVEPDARPFLAERIKSIPTADVRPVVRGKWIPVIRYIENTVVGWECSVCGFGIDISEDGFNYCPKCGADLRECET